MPLVIAAFLVATSALVLSRPAAAAAGTSAGSVLVFPERFDAAGNRYDAGKFWGTVAFGPGAGNTLTALAETSSFVASYTPGGTLRWVHRIGNYSPSSGNFDYSYLGGFAVTPDGSAVVNGQTFGATRISTPYGNRVLPTRGGFDTFLVKFTGTDGHIAFARADGGPGADNATDLALDAFGTIYETGSFTQTATFGDQPASASVTSEGFDDAFIASYTATGTLRWIRPIATGPSRAGGGQVALRSGAMYVSGSWSGPTTIGSSTFTAPVMNDNAFITRVDPTTGTPTWVRLALRRSLQGSVALQSLAVDPTGQVIARGQASGVVGFAPAGYPPTTTVELPTSALFEARYAANGFLQSVTEVPPPPPG